MSDTTQHAQMDFNLPHDVVQLPSKGKFYRNGKKAIKVGYLTAQDENVLMSTNRTENIVTTLLKNKIYEPDIRVNDLLEGDVEAILIFLRNTSFGPEYNFILKDPKTGQDFEQIIMLDELDIIEPKISPNSDGLFEFNLPKTAVDVKCKLLTIGDTDEISKLSESYPKGVAVPIITKRLEKHIVSVNGNTDREYISKFVMNLPIMDSKFIRTTLSDCEPKLNLNRTVKAPSGELVNIRITFGAEFFRPFF
jgi:hypothetical protein